MSCPEDTDAKRLARFYLYRKVKSLWNAGGYPDGHALVLAGNEASEVGCLRDYLGLVPEVVHFVDIKPEGLQEVKSRWKEVHTFHGKVEDALASLREKIGFLNLDFCGFLNEKVVASVKAAANKISVRGVVAYTFARDRENAVTPQWDRILRLATTGMKNDPRYRHIGQNSPEWMDLARFITYGEIMKDLLGKNFEVVFRLRYGEMQKRRMGILAFQHMPPWVRTADWKEEVANLRSKDERVWNIQNIDSKTKLRRIAMELTDHHSPKEVAEILHLPVTTMRAWQAHKTRGSYK